MKMVYFCRMYWINIFSFITMKDCINHWIISISQIYKKLSKQVDEAYYKNNLIITTTITIQVVKTIDI